MGPLILQRDPGSPPKNGVTLAKLGNVLIFWFSHLQKTANNTFLKGGQLTEAAWHITDHPFRIAVTLFVYCVRLLNPNLATEKWV